MSKNLRFRQGAVLFLFFLLSQLSGLTETTAVVTWGGQEIPRAFYTERFSQVAAGGSFNLALKSDGTVVAWGSRTGVMPVGVTDVVQVAAGNGHDLVLKSDGTVLAWGANDLGQATVPSGLTDVVQVSAGFDHSLALKSDGTVMAWGANAKDQSAVPEDLTGVVQVAAGGKYSLALKSDGTVVAWGYNDLGQGSVPNGLSHVVAVAAGSSHSLALKSDGTVVAWGSNSSGQSTVPSGLSHVVAVAAGSSHSLALKSDGTVVAWGLNSDKQSKVPLGLTDVVGITAGSSHSLALKSDGTVVAWGNNGAGQSLMPDDFANVVQVAMAGNHAALKSDGTVLAWGSNVPVPSGLTDVVQVAAGSSHSLALKSDGTVVAWGSNSDGQSTVPIGLADVVQVSAGEKFSLALKSNGTVVGWGYARLGQILIPEGLTGVEAISAGVSHGIALKSDGTVMTWGFDSGSTERPGGLEGVIQVAAGGAISLALKSDGTVAVWGDHTKGKNILPEGLADVEQVTAGRNYCMALKSDGTVVAWGDNTYGQCTVPAGLGSLTVISAGYVTCGTIISVPAYTPTVVPKVLINPVRTVALKMGSARFQAYGLAAAGVSYQWQESLDGIDWEDIPLATAPTLSFVETSAEQDGMLYRARISNAGGTIHTAPAELVLVTPEASVVGGADTATGRVGTSFSYQIVAGNNPVHYSADNLPPGVAVNTGTGAITGTPTTAGTFSTTIGATNGGGTGTKTVGITILPLDPVISSADALSGKVGTALSYQITASNSPVSYGASDLPPGMSVNTKTGAILGTPTTAGTFSATVMATNAGGTGSGTVNFTILPLDPVISSASSVSGKEGTSLSYQITASNNPASYSASGLPSGLAVNTGTGAITGTPTEAGMFNATVSATNTGGTGSLDVTFTIVPLEPVISSASSVSGKEGTSLSYQITASKNPASYSATGLPSGLTLNTKTGAITGTPTTAGTFTATVAATNSGGTGTKTVTFTIIPLEPVISSASSISGKEGVSLSYQITASNSPASYEASDLPPGLAVNASTGKITGKPTKVGTFNTTVKATNAGGTGTKVVKFTIAKETTKPVIAITTPSTLKATVKTSSYTVKGKVTDNINPSKVQYRVDPPGNAKFGSYKTIALASKVATAKTWSCKLTVKTKGVYKIQYRPVDAAGNIGTVKTVVITRK